MQHLVAFVPRPRLNLTRFHGALAPNAKIRSMITPGKPVTENDTSVDTNNVPHHSASAYMSWTRLLKRVIDIDIEHCPQWRYIENHRRY